MTTTTHTALNFKTPFLMVSFCIIWGFLLCLITGIALKGFIFLQDPIFNTDLVITLFLNGFVAFGFITIAYNLLKK